MLPKKIKILLILLGFILAVYGLAKFLIWDSTNFRMKKNQIAIEGYDVISFFKDGKPVKGFKKNNYQWNERIWYFKNGEYRQIFISNPDYYAPRYGGNCAFTTSIGKAQRGLPKYWEMRDGKLYLNSNMVSHFLWKHLPARAAKADQHWKRLTGN